MANVISFTASAALANGVGADVNVIVDGKVIGTTVVGATTQTYSFDTTLATGVGHDIQIQYTNDAVVNGQDRNLSLKSVGVNGQTVSATSSYEVYHAQGQGNLAADGNMYWNGTAEFSLPSSFFPGSSTPSAAGIYVSTSGSDSGSGSTGSPYASLAKAVSAAEQSGVKTIYLEGGKYSMSSTVSLGSAANGITIESAPGAQAVLDGKGSLSTLIQLNGASGVTLQGLTFQDTGSSNAAVVLSGAGGNHIVGNLFSGTHEGVLLTQGSSGNQISGNEIDKSGTSGIEVDNQSNSNTIDSNLINGTGAIGTTGGGIFLHGANNNVISHNQVENTGGMGIGVENWDSNTINVGNSIIDNKVENSGVSSQSTDTGAIYLLGRSDVNTNTTISGNYISSTLPTASHPQIVGIYLDDLTSGVTIKNNIVANTVDHSLQIHGGSNITVENNIFDLGSQSGSTWGWDTAALFQSISGHAMTNNVFSHNIIASTSATPAAYSNLDGGNPTIDNNFYMDLLNSHFQTFGTALNETNAHFGNALFGNEAGGNYTLASNSPALAAGFGQIDQSVMGLHPTGAHWYAAAS
jgi:parallel beta-helix repeat protein